MFVDRLQHLARLAMCMLMTCALLVTTSPSAALDYSDTTAPRILGIAEDSTFKAQGFIRYVITVQDDKHFVVTHNYALPPQFQMRSEQTTSPVCTAHWAVWYRPVLEFKEDISLRPIKPGQPQFFILTLMTEMPGLNSDDNRLPADCPSFGFAYSYRDWYGRLFKDEVGNINDEYLKIASPVSVRNKSRYCAPAINFSFDNPYSRMKTMNEMLSDLAITNDARLASIRAYTVPGAKLYDLYEQAKSPQSLLTSTDAELWNTLCSQMEPLDAYGSGRSERVVSDQVYVQQVQREIEQQAAKAKAEAEARARAEVQAAAEAAARAAAEAAEKAKAETEAAARAAAVAAARAAAESAAKAAAEARARAEAQAAAEAAARAEVEAQAKALVAEAKAKSAAAKTRKKTLTCVKGKQIRKVTGENPKCPAGFIRRP